MSVFHICFPESVLTITNICPNRRHWFENSCDHPVKYFKKFENHLAIRNGSLIIRGKGWKAFSYS